MLPTTISAERSSLITISAEVVRAGNGRLACGQLLAQIEDRPPFTS
jgi:hypothetical protein